MLYLYNSLTRQKELFKPLQPGKIGIYVCGITVYDDCHLGHARSMVSFDVIIRFLKNQGYDVTFVRNITDIDDKIIKRAQEKEQSITDLTNVYIQSMNDDARALNLLKPDKEPRATDFINSIIKLIQQLIAKEFAYLSKDGDVCFEVEKFENYGLLSYKDLEGLIAGVRIEVATGKHSPLDFVLWKRAKPNEPSWPSPWGDGRPGWHIECSAMAMEELGEHFDIHGGGLDLQFPHHENEIAQSECASGKTFANYWLHTGMLQVNNEKMAKSLGNFFTIKAILAKHHPEVVRYFLLSSHYRSTLNYSEDNLINAGKALTRLYQSLKGIHGEESLEIDERWLNKFTEAMNDDFNTPIALSVLFQLSHEINKTQSPILASTLKKLGGILGLLQEVPEEFLQENLSDEIDKDTIEQLIEQRLKARRHKDWIKADEIRNLLSDRGIELEDTQEGTTWRAR